MISGIILAITLITFSSAHAGYRTVLKKWTKTGHSFAFETMDALLIWDATLLSEELLNARRELAKKRKIDIKTPEPEGVTFFVSLYTHKYLKNFSLDEDSAWKVFLVGVDGMEIPPTKIEPITYNIVDKVFYPHVSPWSKPYYIYFPAVDLGHHPKLILRSLAAESAVEWKLK